MNRLHIVGRSNHGKTTCCQELIAALSRQGLRIGAIKHTPHRYELDTPGKDSHLLREAGGNPTAIWAGGLCGIYLPDLPEDQLYARLTGLYADCDLVIVEGHQAAADAPCLEVWRACMGTTAIAADSEFVDGLISDDPCPVARPCFPRADLQAAIDWILAQV